MNYLYESSYKKSLMTSSDSIALAAYHKTMYGILITQYIYFITQSSCNKCNGHTIA